MIETAAQPEGRSWANNECCQCHAVGEVWSKHIAPEHRYANSPEPIVWLCVVCKRRVCINCVYTIPHSIPVEIADPTCCSEACRQKWREQGGVEEPVSTIIVKVQTALNNPLLPALVYDRERTFHLQIAPEQVTERMAGRVKAFFHARLFGEQLALGDEAPAQDW